jgi:hypothetical protein
MYGIGGAEVLGAIGLLIPRVAPFAALGLIATMLGAVRTGIVFSEPMHVVLPLVLIALLAFVIYRRRDALTFWRRR